MEILTQEQKDLIAKSLQERGAKLPCPRCGNDKFIVVDGYFVQTLQKQMTGMTIGGTSIPSAVVACNKCGFLIQHALGVLGLLRRKEPEA